jgi:hypothetical protein
LRWTDSAVEHIRRHRVSRIEVDQMLRNRRYVRPNRRAPGRISIIGRTDGGRVLELALDPTSDPVTWIPVTAMDANAADRQRLPPG